MARKDKGLRDRMEQLMSDWEGARFVWSIALILYPFYILGNNDSEDNISKSRPWCTVFMI